ncbi:MAG: DUF305 domain-containing protein [Thermomicrobiales bacterium]|nr:DUF305 domain-containing protein [Thermomicrobiales bacterium]
MIEPEARRAAAAPREPALVSAGSRWLALGAVLVALLVAGAALWANAHRFPADDSVEAGFARDMVVHHDQAVTMALLIRDRTDDPALKSLATDILLTQQNQIGQMLGWLQVWGLPATGPDLPMAWMGHPVEGQMPGMATPEQMTNLEQLRGEAADVAFLQMMIRHHEGGVPMAEMALEESDTPQVRDLAQAIVSTQQAEIGIMEGMLAQKGAPANPAATQSATPVPG